MRRECLLLALCFALISVPEASPAHDARVVQNEDAVVLHGGGCRKSSPPGKCCHAGSKLLHCH